MFSFVLRIKRRIQKVLKVKSESRQVVKTSVRSRSRKIFMLILAAVSVGVLYPGEDLYDPLDMPRRGEISQEAIIAPFPITVFKTEAELEEERERIIFSQEYIVDEDTTVLQRVLTNLDRFFALVDTVKSVATESDTITQEMMIQTVAERFPRVSRGAIVSSLQSDTLQPLKDVLSRVFERNLYKIGIVVDLSFVGESGSRDVLIQSGERSSQFSVDQLILLAEANGRLLTALNRARRTDSVNSEHGYAVGRAFIEPNLSVNEDEYRRLLDSRLDAISEVKETVEQGEIIVRSGTRVNIRQQRVLDEMARVMRMEAAKAGWLNALIPVLARVVLVLAVFTALYLFLHAFRREVFNSNPRLLALFLVFALQLFLINLIQRWDVSIYLFPVAVLPIMVTILYDAEVGVLSTFVLALLLGIMHRFNFSLTLAVVVVGTVACFASRTVRKRTDFFRILVAVSASYAALIFLVENLKFTPNDEVLLEMGYGLVAGVVSALLTIGILPLFESLFGITTDITLLELSDMNHPLLKRLAIEAPGTYQHSIVVGNLCETAAEAIKGNSLLARVGAYYHDIGKIEIPEYFVENQLSVKSKHEALSATISSLVLASHVKRGRQIGEDSNIPDDVLNFIEEHHGTMVMSFFYNKAIEQGADESVIDKFRYPGPKPQIRETGIAMLADAVEAASRTLENPSSARVDNLIQRIINDRFQSGELDECPLTLRDLAKIKEAFAQVLIAAFHHRVEYPTRIRAPKKNG